ncbi:MAG: hypothetical protein FWD52_09805 [Candidatus Bathyarchaeota archaeon]|nr:hypothetical protein [Candidatus Termiticorpusculum sp.]
MAEQLPHNGKFKVIGVKEADPTKLETRQEIISLVDSAKHSIYATTRLATRFFNNLDVEEVYTRAAAKPVKINFLLEPGIDWNEKQQEIGWLGTLINNDRQDVFKIRQSTEKLPHWIIVDGTHIRLEEEHDEKAALVSNSIIYNTKTQKDVAIKLFAETVLETFALWWKDSTRVHG